MEGIEEAGTALLMLGSIEWMELADYFFIVFYSIMIIYSILAALVTLIKINRSHMRKQDNPNHHSHRYSFLSK